MKQYSRSVYLVSLFVIVIFTLFLSTNRGGVFLDKFSGKVSVLLAAVDLSSGTQTSAEVVSVVPTSLTNKFGFSLAAVPYTLSDADLNTEFNDLASLGVGWVRFDIAWNFIQPNNATSFYWDGTDRIIAAANAHNIKLMPIILYTPSWARVAGCTSDKCAPADPAAFALFAQQVVSRYAPQGVHNWEIWNEPNIPGFWLPAPNVSSYGLLLKDSYVAIKAVDASAVVISGGLSPAATTGKDISPADFLAGLYNGGLGKYFDAVGMHPYSFPVLPSTLEVWNAWSQMSLTATNLRSIMIANNDSSKAIWLTEFGAPTGGPGVMATLNNFQLTNSPDHVDEALQSAIVADAINTAQTYSWAGPLFLYSYKDLGISTDTIENFFGLLRYDGTHKPSYDTLKTLLGPTSVASSTPPPPPVTASTTIATTTTVTSTSSDQKPPRGRTKRKI